MPRRQSCGRVRRRRPLEWTILEWTCTSDHTPHPNPHSASGTHTRIPHRGFLPWRLSDDGPDACGTVVMGRRPKPFTRADMLAYVRSRVNRPCSTPSVRLKYLVRGIGRDG